MPPRTPPALADLSPAKRALLERRLRGRAQPAAPVIPRRAGPGPAPLSRAQERIWFIDQFMPGTPAHNIPAAFLLEGAVDRHALERSLQDIVTRHETLRTVFETTADGPRQRVLDRLAVRIDYHEADSPEHARRLASQAAYLSFDLARGPLFRAALYRTDPDRHLLTLTLHHIIADEWSIAILLQEWTASFHARRTGAAAELPELPVQYRDYAIWEREKDDAGDDDIDYWTRELEDLSAPAPLPSDFMRSSTPSFHGAGLHFELADDVYARFSALARDSGATLFMTLLAAFQAFMFRYTGQDRFAVNWAVANRPARETEALIGCFINILVVRSDIEAGLSFRQLLERVRARAVRCFAHHDAPFEEVVRRLKVERDPTSHPFSQVMLVLLNTPSVSADIPGLRIRPVLLENAATPFDLMVHFWELDNGLGGILRYSTDLYRPETAQLLLGRLEAVFAAIAADPDTALSELPRLGVAERRQILVDWNATATACPDRTCLHELFEHQCRLDPRAVAVAEPQRQCTYGELNERADRFAQRLLAAGIGTESVVGIYCRPSLELIVGLLGILKAGAAYAPLDPAHPAQRLEAMLAAAGADALVTDAALRDELAPPGVGTIVIDDGAAGPGADRRVEPRLDPSNLAYIVFTSGSTGAPKAIAITHRGVVNNMVDVNERLGIDRSDRLLAVSSIGFDMSVHEIFGTLAAGACIVMPAGETYREPREWAALMARHGVTVWSSAPALLDMLLNASAGEAAPWADRLRLVMLAGDWIPVALPGRLRRFAPDATVMSLGGAAEASVYTVAYSIGDVDPDWRSIPYGRPLGNQQVYVVDADLELAPVGVAGELCLAGVGLGRGYVGQPAETAARFVPDPYCEQPGQRLYRTGDLARWMPDGKIELLGRMDLQVKVRGMRIELVEIEATLKRHPAVAEAVVTMHKDDAGEGRLTAYLISADGATVDRPALKQWLRGRLPKQMCPTHFVPLETLPLLPSGKVDRRALPEPEAAPAPDREFAEPRDALETVVHGIWCDVLRTGSIGIHDDFFDLGGHSLLAVQITTRLHAIFGVELPLRTLIEARTVAGLCERLGAGDAQARERMAGIAGLALEVEAMSDDEVRRRIAASTNHAE